MIQLDPQRSALVLIDLQQGIVSEPVAPHSADAGVASGKALAARFRAPGGPVVLVRVAFAADYADALRQPVDKPMVRPDGGLPQQWNTLVDGLQQPGDIVVTKKQWGAFYGTELDLQLRRRSIDSIVLGGIATNFGVESTARQAWELGYGVVVAEDACTSVLADLHAMTIGHVLPRISRIARSDDINF